MLNMGIFAKMKVPAGARIYLFNAPKDYPMPPGNINFAMPGDKGDFIHIFISSAADFELYIEQAKKVRSIFARLWVSYPQNLSTDEVWDMALKHQLHPVTYIRLDSQWQAMWLTDNCEQEQYTSDVFPLLPKSKKPTQAS